MLAACFDVDSMGLLMNVAFFYLAKIGGGMNFSLG
jgi:hypothetical protein